MTWENLLSSKRIGVDIKEHGHNEIRTEYYKDYDRIAFSAPFRRLARKTQVHPLSFNDHIHNRLTHSIEVSSVGRSLGLAVGEKIKGKLPEDISPVDFASIVQAACMAHDIGNPPFGHAGEFAIRQWFTENITSLDESLSDSEIKDLKLFEGNAQGLRVVAQIENHYMKGGLQLTYATLGALIKYPWYSDNKRAEKKGKFNIFQSEKDVFIDIANTLGLIRIDNEQYARHPLSYLMEAADDICYKILDIEDALELNILRINDVISTFKDLAEDDSITDIGDKYSVRKRITQFRSGAIDNLIKRTVEIFEENYDGIMSGDFEDDLISRIQGRCKHGIDEAKEITNKDIFSNRRKIELEVGSYASIDIILNAFIQAINDFVKVGDKEKLSFRSKRILDLMQDDLPDTIDSHYHGYMLVADFVSGMTDNYATFIAKQINGNAK